MRDFTSVPGADGPFAKTTPAPATRWTPEVANSIVQEICTVIMNPAGGNADLNPASNIQLFEAIQRMIRTFVTVTTGATGQLQFGPVIIKWGGYRASITDEVVRTVAFDAAFPTECWRVLLTPVVTSPGNLQDLFVQLITSTRSPSGFSVQFQENDNDDSRASGFEWLAIGY